MPDPIRFAFHVGGDHRPSRRAFAGWMPADPNRGDPLGAVSDRCHDLAGRLADHYGAPVSYYARLGASSHHGIVRHDRPRHPFTAYGARIVDVTR